MPPAWMPMLVAAQTATKRATSPMKRRMRPLKKPPAMYTINIRMGSMSTKVNQRFSRNGTLRGANARRHSLSEPGAVSFLQCQPDLRHHLVHFGVRQGALRASESQGERETLVPFRHLRTAVLVERANLFEQVAGRFMDRAEHHARRDRFIDDHGKVAIDAREPRKRSGARHACSSQKRFDVDLERDEALVDLRAGRDG